MREPWRLFGRLRYGTRNRESALVSISTLDGGVDRIGAQVESHMSCTIGNNESL